VSRAQLRVGDRLWSTAPRDMATVETLADSATPLAMGRSGIFELSGFPASTSLHDLGRMVPLQRGGG